MAQLDNCAWVSSHVTVRHQLLIQKKQNQKTKQILFICATKYFYEAPYYYNYNLFSMSVGTLLSFFTKLWNVICFRFIGC